MLFRSVSAGSYEKRLGDHLNPELWRMLAKTWTDGSPEHCWDALLMMGRLFRRAAVDVGKELAYCWPEADHQRVRAFLRHIRKLPPDAERIF